MSQEELADRAALDRTYVSMIERGLHRVSLEIAAAVGTAFDLSLAALMEQVEREQKPKAKPKTKAASPKKPIK